VDEDDGVASSLLAIRKRRPVDVEGSRFAKPTTVAADRIATCLLLPDYVDGGRTFRFARNRLSGSHAFLISARRSKLAP
jgi:hypothetical protein